MNPQHVRKAQFPTQNRTEGPLMPSLPLQPQILNARATLERLKAMTLPVEARLLVLQAIQYLSQNEACVRTEE